MFLGRKNIPWNILIYAAVCYDSIPSEPGTWLHVWVDPKSPVKRAEYSRNIPFQMEQNHNTQLKKKKNVPWKEKYSLQYSYLCCCMLWFCSLWTWNMVARLNGPLWPIVFFSVSCFQSKQLIHNMRVYVCVMVCVLVCEWVCVWLI